MSRRRWVMPVVLLAVLAAAAVGCGRGDGNTMSNEQAGPAHRIDWDVSGGNELERIDWDAVVGDEHDMVILTDGVDLRLVLPGGEVVEDRFKRVRLRRDDTHLRTVDGVLDRELTLDQAMQVAGQLAERFDFGLHNFEDWHEEMTRRQATGEEWISMTANANGALLSPRGPRPAVRTVRGGHEERPVNLALQFSWRAEGDDYPRLEQDPW